MKIEELSSDKVEIIKSILAGSPNSNLSGSVFVSAGSEVLFDNAQLSSIVVNAGFWATQSGSALIPYAYEVVRRVDENMLDIDRYPLSLSGSAILRSRQINKDFLEHHSSDLPFYYN